MPRQEDAPGLWDKCICTASQQAIMAWRRVAPARDPEVIAKISNMWCALPQHICAPGVTRHTVPQHIGACVSAWRPSSSPRLPTSW